MIEESRMKMIESKTITQERLSKIGVTMSLQGMLTQGMDRLEMAQ